MSAPGEYLKKQRELRSIPLADISNAIKVPLKLLKALEADNYEPLPHQTFVKGFIKAYCKYLGIDENDAVLRYEMFLQEMADFDEEATKKEAEVSRKKTFFSKPANITICLVACGLAAIVAFFLILRPAENASNTADAGKVMGGSANTAVSATAPTIETPAIEVVEVKAPVDVNIMAGPEAVRERVLPPRIEPKTGAAQEAEPVKPVRPIEPAQPTQPAVVSPPQPRRDATNGVNGHKLTATASETTWMQVRIDDKAPFELLLRQNQRATWQADKVFFCTLAMPRA